MTIYFISEVQRCSFHFLS